MFLKLIGLGFSNYTKDSYNLFDALIVIISTVDWVIFRLTPIDAENAMKAFRALRLLRMIKLSRSWKALATILKNMLDTIKPLANFSMLLLLFMYIFALLGMELYGHKINFDEQDYPVEGETGMPLRPNFDNLGMGFTSIFAVAIGDDWNYLMAMTYRAQGFSAILFYPLVFIFMNLILFNLFLAILLHNFDVFQE